MTPQPTNNLPVSPRPPSNKTPYSERGLHPWEQGLEGTRALVGLVSKPGDLVLDPFVGSGTVGVAVLMLARRFIRIDKNRKAVAVARQRLLASPVGKAA